MQREIQNAAAYLYQREIETKQRIIVGVNQFTTGERAAGRHPAGQSRDRAEAECERLARVRAERNAAAAEQGARDESRRRRATAAT